MVPTHAIAVQPREVLTVASVCAVEGLRYLDRPVRPLVVGQQVHRAAAPRAESIVRDTSASSKPAPIAIRASTLLATDAGIPSSSARRMAQYRRLLRSPSLPART